MISLAERIGLSRWVVLAVLLASSARVEAADHARSSLNFIRGMALGHYTDIKPAELQRKLDELKRLGVQYVSVVVSWSTRDVRSTEIAPRKNHTTPDRVTRRIIARARAKGLRVILFPILDVQRRKPLEWRGTVKPRDWDAWWRSYRRFIMHYARVAAAAHADVLCVGSELVSTERMRKRWKQLIGGVRKVFRGKLLYSANWDHYKQLSFWDLVDVVGLTAYYQLATKRDAPESTMVTAWRRVREKLLPWARKIGRKILFTEVGYPSQDGCAVHPWDYTQGTPVDLEEQRRAYSAFVRAWRGTSELAGVVFWDWYGRGGPKDTRYTPRNKPAAAVIRSWFRNGRGSATGGRTRR